MLSCSDETLLQETYVPCSRQSDFSLIGKRCDWNGILSKTSTGSCNLGTFECKSEDVICVGARFPEKEICDGLDNNCDGRMDNIIDSSLELCYEGPTNTVIHSPCRAGIKMCKNAKWKCEGQILPAAKDICGDEIDNDCNGIIDDYSGVERKYYDIVMIIDRSGSMSVYMSEIKSVLRTASNLDNNFYKVWLLDLPLTFEEDYGPNVECHGLNPNYPLLPCTPNDLSFAAQEIDAARGSVELSYDILYDIATNRIQFNWTENAIKYVLLFSDEPGQTATDLTELEVANLYTEINFIGFVQQREDFDDIGSVFQLENVDLNKQFKEDVVYACH